MKVTEITKEEFKDRLKRSHRTRIRDLIFKMEPAIRKLRWEMFEVKYDKDTRKFTVRVMNKNPTRHRALLTDKEKVLDVISDTFKPHNYRTRYLASGDMDMLIYEIFEQEVTV